MTTGVFTPTFADVAALVTMRCYIHAHPPELGFQEEGGEANRLKGPLL